MNIKDQILNSFESIFLTLILAWSVGITVALVNPDVRPTPQGTVEVYSLVADGQPTA